MHAIHDWLLLQDGTDIYVALFLLLLGGAFGLPIPEDIPLIFGGILTQLGRVSLAPVFLICYSAILLGDTVIYAIGRWLGPAVFKRKLFDNESARARVKRIRLGLERRSLIMVFVARHIFYIRTLTFLTCGAFKMRFSRFLIADSLAALISVPLMMGIGYWAADNFDRVSMLVKEAKIVTVALVVLAVVVYLIRRALRKEVEPEPVDVGLKSDEVRDRELL